MNNKNPIQWLREKFPGGDIALLVTAINTSAILFTQGILFTGCVAGAALSISTLMLYTAAPPTVKNFILRWGSGAGWIVDTVITLGLACLGFTFGATMGVVSLFIGLNVSAMFALIRWFAKKKGVQTPNVFGFS